MNSHKVWTGQIHVEPAPLIKITVTYGVGAGDAIPAHLQGLADQLPGPRGLDEKPSVVDKYEIEEGVKHKLLDHYWNNPNVISVAFSRTPKGEPE